MLKRLVWEEHVLVSFLLNQLPGLALEQSARTHKLNTDNAIAKNTIKIIANGIITTKLAIPFILISVV